MKLDIFLKQFSEIETNCQPKVGDFVRLRCKIKRQEKIYYAMVVEIVGEDCFSVRYLAKSSSSYTWGREDDVGLIKEGPPDHFCWVVLKPSDYQMNKRGLFSFNF